MPVSPGYGVPPPPVDPADPNAPAGPQGPPDASARVPGYGSPGSLTSTRGLLAAGIAPALGGLVSLLGGGRAGLMFAGGAARQGTALLDAAAEQDRQKRAALFQVTQQRADALEKRMSELREKAMLAKGEGWSDPVFDEAVQLHTQAHVKAAQSGAPISDKEIAAVNDKLLGMNEAGLVGAAQTAMAKSQAFAQANAQKAAEKAAITQRFQATGTTPTPEIVEQAWARMHTPVELGIPQPPGAADRGIPNQSIMVPPEGIEKLAPSLFNPFGRGQQNNIRQVVGADKVVRYERFNPYTQQFEPIGGDSAAPVYAQNFPTVDAQGNRVVETVPRTLQTPGTPHPNAPPRPGQAAIPAPPGATPSPATPEAKAALPPAAPRRLAPSGTGAASGIAVRPTGVKAPVRLEGEERKTVNSINALIGEDNKSGMFGVMEKAIKDAGLQNSNNLQDAVWQRVQRALYSQGFSPGQLEQTLIPIGSYAQILASAPFSAQSRNWLNIVATRSHAPDLARDTPAQIMEKIRAIRTAYPFVRDAVLNGPAYKNQGGGVAPTGAAPGRDVPRPPNLQNIDDIKKQYGLSY